MILVFYCTVQFDLLLQFYNFKYSISSDTKTQVINTVENVAIQPENIHNDKSVIILIINRMGSKWLLLLKFKAIAEECQLVSIVAWFSNHHDEPKAVLQ